MQKALCTQAPAIFYHSPGARRGELSVDPDGLFFEARVRKKPSAPIERAIQECAFGIANPFFVYPGGLGIFNLTEFAYFCLGPY